MCLPFSVPSHLLKESLGKKTTTSLSLHLQNGLLFFKERGSLLLFDSLFRCCFCPSFPDPLHSLDHGMHFVLPLAVGKEVPGNLRAMILLDTNTK